MLKVWQGTGRYFAECDQCKSYGLAHLKPITKITDPDLVQALDRQAATALALRTSFTKAAAALNNQIREGSLSRKEGSAKIRELWTNHNAQIQLLVAARPDTTGKVKTIITQCPWCKAESGEVEIEILPDHVREPPFTLARNPVPAPPPPQNTQVGKAS